MKYKCKGCGKVIGKGDLWNSYTMIGDGKFNSIRGRKYCEPCYFNDDRNKWSKEQPSINLSDLLVEAHTKNNK